ncbi:MAG: coenzyme F420-0:L-glutamate ligase, partial [Spirochaetota bacterium]
HNCQIFPLKLPLLQPPQDDLLRALFTTFRILRDEEGFVLQDGDILFLSAKIVAIGQGRCLLVESQAERSALIRKESDAYIANILPSQSFEGRDFPFTLKGQTPVPFAGIDESNGNGWHVLWPENLEETVSVLHKSIAAECSVKSFALVIADSTVFPLRRGCIGVSCAAYGLQVLHSYKGQTDLFGRDLELSENNIVDRLSSFATLFMGEGAEQTPAVVLRGLKQFVCEGEDFSSLFMDREVDFYWPLFKSTSTL